MKGSKQKREQSKLENAFEELDETERRIEDFFKSNEAIICAWLELQETKEAVLASVKTLAAERAESLGGSLIQRSPAGWSVRTNQQRRRTFDVAKILEVIPEPSEWPELFTVKAKEFDKLMASGMLGDVTDTDLTGEPKIVYQTTISEPGAS